MSRKDPIRLYIGDEFNPEKRAGMPRKVGGERYLTTWFTCGRSWRWASDDLLKRMKEARAIHGSTRWVLVEFYRDVYYKDGRFYRAHTTKSATRSGDFSRLVPVDGTIYTCKPKYQKKYGLPDAEIVCIDGYPVSVRIGQDAFDVGDSWSVMEAFLGLDECYKPEKYRPGKVA